MKAIAWSPHHHGLLASGGGTADRYIRFTMRVDMNVLNFKSLKFTVDFRFWNTLTGQPMQSVDTGSQVEFFEHPHLASIQSPTQVCNLAWSKHASELVSTHGYSQNQILVWKYPSLVQVIIKS